MIILAFDGTAKYASVAALSDNGVLASYHIDNGLTQSELLLPMADDMLKSLKLSFDEVELFACSAGPGSFTGVRIGVSLVKGLAFGRNIPCCAVSTLEALAENLYGIRGIIVPCMDARRSQVYNAIFEYDGTEMKRLTEDRAISLDDLAEELRSYSGKPIYLTGDGYYIAKRAMDAKGISVEETPPVLIPENAASVGRVAHRMYCRGEYVTEAELAPVYLRLPQAERERLERLSEAENK